MKNLIGIKPDEVVAEVRKEIRRRLGDDVENISTVYASHGFFYIILRYSLNSANASPALRRNKIAGWLKGQKV
jgi:hypothetical protein